MSPPARGSLLDTVLMVVAVVAIGALAYVGFTWWMGRTPGGPPPAVTPAASIEVAAAGSAVAWTEEDTAACHRQAKAAQAAGAPRDLVLANPAIVPGFANLATELECHIVTKPSHNCAPAEKEKLVIAVKDYLDRVNLIAAALSLQGAPMQLVGGMLGGEAKAGSEIYEITRKDSMGFMKIHNDRIADGLRMLARNGIITAGDFGAFMGVGVPPEIKSIIGDTTAERHVCG